MGIYDLPAQIDHILNTTHKDKLAAYIGHSEGTTQMFIGSSLIPKYFSDRVELFLGFAPVVRLEHNTNAMLTYTAKYVDYISMIIQKTGMYNFMQADATKMSVTTAEFCTIMTSFCEAADEGFFDWNEDIINKDRYAASMAHGPAGTGWRNLIHYA